MTVIKTTFLDYQAQKAAIAIPVTTRRGRLVGASKHLDGRQWTDTELAQIPENLARFAYENSSTIRKEFGSFDAFMAYRTACAAGVARIAGRR